MGQPLLGAMAYGGGRSVGASCVVRGSWPIPLRKWAVDFVEEFGFGVGVEVGVVAKLRLILSKIERNQVRASFCGEQLALDFI